MTHAEHQAVTEFLLERRDYAMIAEIVEPGARVLDLGCGGGELLAWLRENKRVDARGVEISGEKVQKAIARGVRAGIQSRPDVRRGSSGLLILLHASQEPADHL